MVSYAKLLCDQINLYYIIDYIKYYLYSMSNDYTYPTTFVELICFSINYRWT